MRQFLRQPDIVLVGEGEEPRPDPASARCSSARKLPVARSRSPFGMQHTASGAGAVGEVGHDARAAVRGAVVAPVEPPVAVGLRGQAGELVRQIPLTVEGGEQDGDQRSARADAGFGTVSVEASAGAVMAAGARGGPVRSADSQAGPPSRPQITPHRPQAAFFTSRFIAIIVSAICTAFSAAPLRRLSDTHQNDRPCSTVGSLRMRLTKTASSPAHSTGVT